MRWRKGVNEGDIIVSNYTEGTLTLNYSIDLSFNRNNNVYVLASGNVRILKFETVQLICLLQ